MTGATCARTNEPYCPEAGNAHEPASLFAYFALHGAPTSFSPLSSACLEYGYSSEMDPVCPTCVSTSRLGSPYGIGRKVSSCSQHINVAQSSSSAGFPTSATYVEHKCPANGCNSTMHFVLKQARPIFPVNVVVMIHALIGGLKKLRCNRVPALEIKALFLRG